MQQRSDAVSGPDDASGLTNSAGGEANHPTSRRASGPLTVFIAWLGFLICVVYFAGALVNAQPPWRTVTSNWDTGWYLTIVEDGYQTVVEGETNLAFFPLYPLSLRLISRLGPDPVVVGVTLSLASFLAALFLVRTLVAEKVSEEVAHHTLLLLAFWPFSFFFGLAYTESLFLLLAVGAFYFVHRGRWWLAAVCAGLAGGTRAVGVFVALAVVLAYLEKVWQPTVKSSATVVGLTATGLSGVSAFMIFLKLHTGSFLAFLEAQRFWPGRADGITGLGWIPKVLQTRPVASYDFALVVVYMVPMLLFLALGLYVLFRIDAVWGGFCLFVLLAPVPTGSLASTNRYVLALFPCFVAAAKLLGQRTPVAVAASAGFLGLFAYHYTYHSTAFVG